MQNRWSESDCAQLTQQHPGLPALVAQKLYSSRLIGQEPSLVLHGGGNGSIKVDAKNRWGETEPCLYIKASGADQGSLTVEQLPALRLDELSAYLRLDQLSDDEMASAMRQHLLDPQGANPSIEALVHGVLPHLSIDHSHADAVLTLSLLAGGQEILEDLYPDFAVLPYYAGGFELAKAVLPALNQNPEIQGMILMHHGLITFAETPKDSYGIMIEAVSRAEQKVQQLKCRDLPCVPVERLEQSKILYKRVAPMLRGVLNQSSPGQSVLFFPVFEPSAQGIIDLDPELLSAGPITPDHLIRTKSKPLILRDLDFKNEENWLQTIRQQWGLYQQAETQYQRAEGSDSIQPTGLPKVILIPGLCAIAVGSNPKQASITCDVLRQTLQVKQAIWETKLPMVGLSESHLYEMEFRPLQQKKLAKSDPKPLEGRVAIISGAAGAIGSGIGNELALAGAQVVLTDLPGTGFDQLVASFSQNYPGQIFGHPMDVTNEASIQSCLDAVSLHWGGLDLMVINAGLAHVSKLSEMDLQRFQTLEKVNVEGTLLMLKAGAQRFKHQGSGGDIVLISTKNVFSPSASFGAYSATKAGSHQLARVASLELAELDVRVNMVSPDGVFSDQGAVKSGLWATVGPDRMKARGLDEEGLETYYQNRNLLKTKVTARHVGRAVLYFATRQSPCTGATLPVDGGLPDATPR